MKRNATPIIVFDIGGTWFRFGLLSSKNRLLSTSKRPAINYKNTPHKSVKELQKKLVNFIWTHTKIIREKFPRKKLNTVSISMGAALNAHTGYIFNSGPLWGPKCEPFDLKRELNRKDKSVKWVIVNDVSAALLKNIQTLSPKQNSKITLVTISSGIGARTYDWKTKTIPVDPKFGIQGEIGHIPVSYEFRNLRFELVCDCGGLNHLNAFCSGRGIDVVLSVIQKRFVGDYKKSSLYQNSQDKKTSFTDFLRAIKRKDTFSLEILDSVTKPLAELLISLFTFEPETSKILLTGGVVHSLGKAYSESLTRNLNLIGLYQITNRNRHFFRKKVEIAKDNNNSGLIGAGIYARIKKLENNEKALSTAQNVQYQIITKNNLFNIDNPPDIFTFNTGGFPSKRRLVIIDSNVIKHHGGKINYYLKHHLIDAQIVSVKVNEEPKHIGLSLK